MSPLSEAGSSKDEDFESLLSKAGSNGDDDFENENISLMWFLMPFEVDSKGVFQTSYCNSIRLT